MPGAPRPARGDRACPRATTRGAKRQGGTQEFGPVAGVSTSSDLGSKTKNPQDFGPKPDSLGYMLLSLDLE